MPSISRTLLKAIADMLELRPLQPGELRRLERMGSHSISLQPAHDGKQWLFSVSIKGKEYFIFKS
jgi:hypothetical protein